MILIVILKVMALKKIMRIIKEIKEIVGKMNFKMTIRKMKAKKMIQANSKKVGKLKIMII